jgi:hypothetical protein
MMGITYKAKTLNEAVAYMYLKGGDFDDKKTEISNGQYVTYFFKKNKKVAVYNHLCPHLFVF